jgi:Na+/H+-dicarboxylate symporter
MGLGVVAGFLCHLHVADGHRAAVASYFSIITEVFLRLIKMIIAPLVFATLVSGLANMDDAKSIGRIGMKTLSWFFGASLISLSIGLLFVNVMHPGTSHNAPGPDAAAASASLQSGVLNFNDFVTHIFPKSIFEAMANNDILPILVFAMFFGIALGRVPGEAGHVLRLTVDGVVDVMFRITKAVMLLAPLGIFAALAAAITVHGLSILLTYGALIGSFYAALASLWIVLILAGYIILRRRVFDLVKIVREPMLIAFSTSSSEAAYPSTIESLKRFGIEERIVGFVLPLGYSFNLDGSMVFQAFASVFIAQAFGVNMTLGNEILMLLVLMISSKGMAAVPRGSLVVLSVVLPMFGLPEAGVLLVMGVDQFLDMGRTATNVLGNSIATAVVSKWEGQLA